jgi:hypothetical protein
MNDRVFLRCSGKRWRQERDDALPGEDPYFPIPSNQITFRNLVIRIPIDGGN